MKLSITVILVCLFSAACIPRVQAQRTTVTDNLRVKVKIDLNGRSITDWNNFYDQPATPGGTLHENDLWYDSSGGNLYTFDGSAWVQVATNSAAVEDGDKGDITVSGNGATWTIDAGVVTPSMLDRTYLETEVDGDPANELQTLAQVLAEGNSAGARITGLTDPAGPQDAATKGYVDGKSISGLSDNLVPRSNAAGDGLEDSDIYSHTGDIGINRVPAGEAVLQIQTTSVQPFIELYYANGVLASQWGNTVADSSMFFDVERPGAGIVFRLDGNDERMRIDGPTGNVGILNQSPAVELDVTGDIRTSGQVQFGGSANYINNDIAGNLAFVTGAGNKISFNAEVGSTDLDISATGTSVGTVLHANRLDVEGGAAIGAGYSGTAIAPANGLIVEGLLGVGTSSPEAGIHVEDVGAYEILRSTNGSLSSRITFENEADDSDSWQLRRDPGGSFTIGHSALQPYGTESVVVVMTAEEFRTYTNSILVENIAASTASALSMNNGRIVYVNSTDATFTSPGFWGVVDGSWTKISNN
ncbi:MAG: hypothetical protein AAFX78_14665 [Cyanobacteria bacterium J06638_20]